MKHRLVTPEELARWCDQQAATESGARQRRFRQVALALRTAVMAATTNRDTIISMQAHQRQQLRRIQHLRGVR